MATYKGIQGFSIQNVTSDPTTVGQVWYNSTGTVFKLFDGVTGSASWATGGNLGTARYLLGGAGTQTAGLAFAGLPSPGNALTEEYNGSSWTAGGNLGTPRHSLAGCGTQTAALAFGGPSSNTSTEEYNGSSWTGGGNRNNGRRSLGGVGTQTAGLAFAGSPNPNNARTEEYNGSSWTNGGNMSAGRVAIAGAGTQTAGLAIGGNGPLTSCEEYNGSSWTNGGALPGGGLEYTSGFGTQTAAVAALGQPPPAGQNTTLTYDGSSWSTSANASTPRARLAAGGASPGSAGVVFGGDNNNTPQNATEEFTGAIVATKTITTT